MADVPVTTTLKRHRTSRPKNKTGCGTCKARHKRCDEAKPICGNCIRTGRVCDGYEDTPGGARVGGHRLGRTPQQAGPPGTPLELGPFASLFADQREAQGFRFFETGTAVQLAHSLHDQGWMPLLFQLSRQEPSIRHAAIALGALSHRYELSELSVRPAAPEVREIHHYAMQQYSKAISQLSAQLTGRPEPGSLPVSALLCSTLLISFDFLQGNPEGVLSHIKHAIQLAQAVGPDRIGRRIWDLLVMVDMLTVLWLGLEHGHVDGPLPFQALYAGPPPPPARAFAGPSDLDALAAELVEISNDVLMVRHAVGRARADPTHASAPVFAAVLKETIESRLDIWRAAFDKAPAAAGDDDEENAAHRRALLRANYVMLTLIVDTLHIGGPSSSSSSSSSSSAAASTLTEAPLPRHGCTKTELDRHREIVDLAEAALADSRMFKRYDLACGERAIRGTGLLPVFSFRHSFVRPLFFVAQCSPDYELRWRAVGLLLNKPWREGAWESAVLGLHAKRTLES